MDPALLCAVSEKLGIEIVSSRPLAGGDINQAFGAELADGRRVFVKTNPRAKPAMFTTEARGLRWLAEANALRTPRVLAVSDESPARFLVLEYIAPAAQKKGFDEALGRGLAGLHRFGAPSFGLDYDNFIGSLPQRNAPRPTWAAFYAEQRLEAQLKSATDAGLVGASLADDFETLFARIDALVGSPEPPSRLHGDLWGGNLHVGDQGEPCLIDPAVYGGHREVDLAMMRLFGGFGARVFDAYEEAWPLADGHEGRVALYQLYPLLVHVNLFGGGYVGQVARAVRAVLASA